MPPSVHDDYHAQIHACAGPRTGRRHLLRIGHSVFPQERRDWVFTTGECAALWVTGGRLTIREGSTHHYLEAGWAFRRPIDCAHTLDIAAGTTWYYLALPARSAELAQDLGRPLPTSWWIGPRPTLVRRCERTLRAFQRLGAHQELAQTALLLDLLARWVSAASSRQPDPDAPHAGAVARAVDFITGDLARRWRVDELAVAVGLSAQAFRKAFTARLGLPPQRYMIQQRLDRACAQLAASDDTVAAIAAAVGYDDPFQFTTLFTRTLGCSPRQWRETARTAPGMDR